MLHVNVNYKENDSWHLRSVWISSKKIGSSSDLTPEEVEADTGRHSLAYGQKQALTSKKKR